jgi:hypothetical protein
VPAAKGPSASTTACEAASCNSTRPSRNAADAFTRRAPPVTISAVGESGCGAVAMPSSARARAASGTVARPALTRRKTGARVRMCDRTGSNRSPSAARSRGASHSGQSRRTSGSATGAGGRASASESGGGAWPSPVKTVAGSAPASRSAPIMRPRPVSAPPIAAKERRQRIASKTWSRMAARSPLPAKRFARAQLVSARSAGSPESQRSRSSMAAAMRAAGVTGAAPAGVRQRRRGERSWLAASHVAPVGGTGPASRSRVKAEGVRLRGDAEDDGTDARHVRRESPAIWTRRAIRRPSAG